MADLRSLSAREAAWQIAERGITAEALVTAYLDRIEAREAVVGAWQYLDRERALATARQRDAEAPRGPLHGVPIAVKDLCWTQGVPTAAGMTIYKDYRPTEDATVVRKLYAAGAIILGKLQLTEGAYADHHPQIPPPLTRGMPRTGQAPPRAVPVWRRPRDFVTAHSVPILAVPSGFRPLPTA